MSVVKPRFEDKDIGVVVDARLRCTRRASRSLI